MSKNERIKFVNYTLFYKNILEMIWFLIKKRGLF